MKKTYMKPEVNEIEVSANQAVAACGVRTGYRCYGERWDISGSAQEAWNKNEGGHSEYPGGVQTWAELRTTPETAFNSHYVFPVFTISGTNEAGRSFSVTVDDLNNNGILDSGEQNNQWDDVGLGAYIGQSIAAIMS